MKKNPSLSFQQAAERVHFWFGKDKEQLFAKFANPTLLNSFGKNHKCNWVKLPPISSSVGKLSLPPFKIEAEGEKKKKKTLFASGSSNRKELKDDAHQTNHCINQKYLYPGIPCQALSSERVAAWRLKEHLVGFKKLKELTLQTTPPRSSHQIVSFKPNAQSENTYQDWYKTKEERHFLITRIIKYY